MASPSNHGECNGPSDASMSVHPLYGGDVTDLSADEIKGMEFESLDKCQEWYQNYALAMGFGIRKEDIRRNKDGDIVMRAWVCARQGERAPKHLQREDRVRQHRDITRTSCNAKFRVNLIKGAAKWVVKDAVVDHTHDLTPADHVRFIPSNRVITESQKALTTVMHDAGIPAYQIMELLAQHAGDYARLHFDRKDLYNHLQSRRAHSMPNGDAETALAFLRGQKSSDAYFFYATQQIDGRLASLFWADSRSQVDYECFGDVLVFDSTYNTNHYNMPLVLFVGVNHHHQSIVFASALLKDETCDTYKWVLQQFLTAMKWKAPKSVVTDGDQAMARAIQLVFPRAHHRLCIWHLERNAQAHVQTEGFLFDFKTCMLDVITTNQFTNQWKALVDKYDLHDNTWVKKMYKTRRSWAEAYLRGNGQFWANIRSTQRCEGMNSAIKKVLDNKLRLFELLENMSRKVDRLRHQEAKEDHTSLYSKPVLTKGMHLLKTNASNLFTRASFRLVLNEMDEERDLFLARKIEDSAMQCIHYTLQCSKNNTSTWAVQFNSATKQIYCSCHMFETVGIPCSHAFHIMKAERLEEIPSNLILKRWTKNAKSDVTHVSRPLDKSNDVQQLMRYTEMTTQTNRLCFLASQIPDGYNGLHQIRKDIDSLTHRMEDLHALYVSAPHDEHVGPSCTHTFLRDPNITKTKGDKGKGKQTTKQRRCGNCKVIGHNKRSCPDLQPSDDHGMLHKQSDAHPISQIHRNACEEDDDDSDDDDLDVDDSDDVDLDDDDSDD